MKDSRSIKPSYQLLIIDILVFAFLGVCESLVGMVGIFFKDRGKESLLLGIAIPSFLFILVGIVLYLFVEYKFNRLKIKNVFLCFAIVITLANIVAVSTLPSEVILPNGAEPMIITPMMRTYYLLSGFGFALLPYLCFYLIPRKILHHKYMRIILYVVLAIAIFLIFTSFIFDWNSYTALFVGNFNEEHALKSLCGHKNIFANYLLYGVFATILLRIYKKDAKWLLFNILLYPMILLTLSKIVIVVATLTLLIYFIVRLVMICRKDYDNLVITLMVSGFFALILSMFIVGIVRSESGVLFSVKNLFIKLGESAKTTFDSRMIIWRCSFQLLAPHQYIFGFGIDTFGLALHNTYAPVAPAFDAHGIYHAHNIVVELIGRGGIITLGIYLFLYVYLVRAAIKVRGRTPYLSLVVIVLLCLSLGIGIVEPAFICGTNWAIFLSTVTVFPIMSEYYIQIDKNEQEVRQEIIKQAMTIKKVNFKCKLLELNKKRIIFDAKCIAYDLNSKIKF